MYKIKFNDLTLITNKNKFQKKNVIFFFMESVCSSNDFKFLFKSLNKKFSINNTRASRS